MREKNKLLACLAGSFCTNASKMNGELIYRKIADKISAIFWFIVSINADIMLIKLSFNKKCSILIF